MEYKDLQIGTKFMFGDLELIKTDLLNYDLDEPAEMAVDLKTGEALAMERTDTVEPLKQ